MTLILVCMIIFNRIKHEFVKRFIRYDIPLIVNNTSNLLKNKIVTRGLHGFSSYVKNFFLQNYQNLCSCLYVNKFISCISLVCYSVSLYKQNIKISCIKLNVFEMSECFFLNPSKSDIIFYLK